MRASGESLERTGGLRDKVLTARVVSSVQISMLNGCWLERFGSEGLAPGEG